IQNSDKRLLGSGVVVLVCDAMI
ncbi:hypothetical protein A2U01_0082442, partial [Trifolium medium]|nr:hypothetical protein [Trifolium medium]